jgi:predicted enzyme related to lactoylglutathione lyase
MMQQPPQAPGGGWLFYFGVKSVLAAHRAILAGGGRVMREPHEVPGGGWIVMAADPQGAVFGITGPKGE